MEFKKINKISKEQLLLIILLITQVFTMIIWGQNKQGFFMDEISTYGLSNSYYNPFTNWNADYYNEWKTTDYYMSYVETHEGTQFRYDSVYYNQSIDVHPPLYYYLLHTVCSFFPDQFTKWFGIGLNIVFYLIANILIFKISKKYFQDKWLWYIPVLFYGFSIVAASTVMFIRMYMLMTLLVLFLLYVHTYYVFDQDTLDKKSMILCAIATWLGSSTQYFFIYIAFFLTVFTCIWFAIKKQFKVMIKYALSMLCGIILLAITFPPMFKHVFSGYRGVETINNLTSFSDKSTAIKEYLYVIFNGMFAGLGTNIPIVITGIAALLILVIAGKIVYDRKQYGIAVIIMTIICYFVMIAVGVSGVVSRHLYCIYPLIAIVAVWIFASILSTRTSKAVTRIITIIFSIVICFVGYVNKDVEWLYQGGDYAKFLAYYNRETPAIFLCDMGYESSSNYFEMAEYDSFAVVRYESEDILSQLLEQKNNPMQLIIYVVNDQRGSEMVNEVAMQYGYAEIKQLNLYNGTLCYLLTK